jgi:hypothetical protein
MALIEYLRPLIMAGGFLFIMVGLNILIAEQPTYETTLFPLYLLVQYTFYLYMVFIFISVLLGGFDALLKLRGPKQGWAR